MNENETEIINSTNDTEETVNPEETTEESDVDSDEKVDVEALKKENETLKAQKEHWRNKATTKPEKVETVAQPTNALSQKDLLALVKADVPEDDVDEVLEYASFKKIPVAEALKTDVIKTLLSKKAEARNLANATNTGSSRKSNATASDDVLLSKANKGELPTNEDDIARLFRLRKGLK